MKLFRIVIKNDSGYEVYNSLISADDETEALKNSAKRRIIHIIRRRHINNNRL